MYELHPPAPDLAPFIEHYWLLRSTDDAPVDLRVNVYVDARADLILNDGAPYVRTVIGGVRRKISASNLDAQRLEPICIEQRGAIRVAGVRFRVGGVGAFSRVALRGLTGCTPAPTEVFGADASGLEDRVRTAPDVAGVAAEFDEFFRARRTDAMAFETFRRALQAFGGDDELPSVAEAARSAGVTPRQVARLFAHYLGIAPGTYRRVVRFQRALRMLMTDPGCTLADVAATAGYFDQAHFVRDFREMTGGVPRGYRGYYPEQGPNDFAPNVVAFVQEADEPVA